MERVRSNGVFLEKGPIVTESKSTAAVSDIENGAVIEASAVQDHTVRKLKPRHIQLIGIAGTIGSL